MNPPNLASLHAVRARLAQLSAQRDPHRDQFHALAQRHAHGTAPRAITAFNLFQTPEPIAQEMARLLNLAPGARVLEPSAGLGRLVRALTPHHRREIGAVEIAPDCSRELRATHPGHTHHQADFLALTPADLGQFDAVIMNPPFHRRADLAHIQHARKFLRPGGTLAALCLAGEARETALRPHAAHWQPLPGGTFRSEGTNVETILLTLRPA